jgi:hypothetical protein
MCVACMRLVLADRPVPSLEPDWPELASQPGKGGPFADRVFTAADAGSSKEPSSQPRQGDRS